MGEQIHYQPPRQERKEEEVAEISTPEQDTAKLDEIDELLAEIDEALEENAIEIVEQYVQEGGQ